MGRLIGLFLNSRPAVLGSVALALFMALAPANLSFADDDHDRVKKLRESGDVLSLEDIIKKATGEHPGRIIEVELDVRGGRYVYKIEILDKSGTVWELEYDAKTGKFLGEKED
ncbi:hypothetical protein MNBD_NITROSPINAE01-838 [hydrothermal vent metagenome]|uniref:PepSY domain-containing protein n=1 Tax=hydrothermal vent metagenome TaxID=652676 RepID=A0A3B1BNW5_9ZZZZ